MSSSLEFFTSLLHCGSECEERLPRCGEWLFKYALAPQAHEDFWSERMHAMVYLFLHGDIFGERKEWLKVSANLRTPKNEVDVRKRVQEY